MYVTEPELPPHVVHNYEFTFTNGQFMAVTIDKDAGDLIVIDKEGVNIKLVAKPSLMDPSKTLLAEELTIFTKHIVAIRKIEQEIPHLTAEQQFAWKQTVKELSSTVQ